MNELPEIRRFRQKSADIHLHGSIPPQHLMIPRIGNVSKSSEVNVSKSMPEIRIFRQKSAEI